MWQVAIANSKGGVGKSHLASLLYHSYKREEIPVSYQTNDFNSPDNLPLVSNPTVLILDYGGFAPKSAEWDALQSAGIVVIPTTTDTYSVKASLNFHDEIANPNKIVVCRGTEEEVQIIKQVFPCEVFRLRNSTAATSCVDEGRSPWDIQNENPLLKRSWKPFLAELEIIFERTLPNG
jgi:cellulose biosynthesis protein BcsQ